MTLKTVLKKTQNTNKNFNQIQAKTKILLEINVWIQSL